MSLARLNTAQKTHSLESVSRVVSIRYNAHNRPSRRPESSSTTIDATKTMLAMVVAIVTAGTSTKAEVVRGVPTDCQVAAYSLADFNFTVLDNIAVLPAYTATPDAVCAGEKAGALIRVAVNYVKRNGRWLEAMYMQAP